MRSEVTLLRWWAGHLGCLASDSPASLWMFLSDFEVGFDFRFVVDSVVEAVVIVDSYGIVPV